MNKYHADQIDDKVLEIFELTDSISELLSGAIEEMYEHKIDSGIIGNVFDAKSKIKEIEKLGDSIQKEADSIEDTEDHEEPEPCECEDYEYFKATDQITYHCESNWDRDMMHVIENLFFSGLSAQQITQHLQQLNQYPANYGTVTDEELIQITKEFKEGLGIEHPQLVCWPLAGYLSSVDLECATADCLVTMEDGDYPHCIIILPDMRILDACADNFELPIAIYDKLPDNYKLIKN